MINYLIISGLCVVFSSVWLDIKRNNLHGKEMFVSSFIIETVRSSWVLLFILHSGLTVLSFLVLLISFCLGSRTTEKEPYTLFKPIMKGFQYFILSFIGYISLSHLSRLDLHGIDVIEQGKILINSI